ncbi:bifunctional diaminohydroxyphosphoribosylaminopyrimidine deaminase/5-amino-6-(5-phosphoribosylamino)uracil reductase RibD [Agilicoccus flavus]|uniref:bifunctional diaminohydroxyphosphoribosylaminopyrimidine deaminase/5-amino-6-(5-phosphoribosylamino)uracil reductase RibD n=1 Tax=Agilicoccus flavus TaxID=2775968 RepID=UPI001CF64B30|nr:bifunctional diaminohydroxyphosphoribosylaminopyrimidine deaminase/5-amino-6-(5-phosphoribosylamino)uracil reductase RibD [Agilicoccus flavus]
MATQPHLADAARPGDRAAMALALELAERGPIADPNPRVGCVVLDRDGALAGAGHHAGAGTPHAEAVALADAAARGADVRGGTVFVTLEPCNHTGRTGPCALALAAAGPGRVVYAQADPGAASGGGARELARRGVLVEVDAVAGPPAHALNRAWTHAIATGRPFVTWKTATTLDGRIAAADGSSRWITGPAARADVHALRARCGAIVVGTGTALADDPALDVRTSPAAPTAARGPAPVRRPPDVPPLRVVVGERPLPADARLLDGRAPTLIRTDRDLPALLADLHAREIRHVLLEGGATLAAAFARAGFVDEVVAYVAPAFLGSGPGGLGDLGVGTIGDAWRLDLHDVTRLGDDVRLTLTPRRPAAGTPPEKEDT